jgi:hypothetical protein
MKFLALVLLPLNLWAAANKNTCTAKELARQDCHLRAGGYELSLLEKTVAWNDGIWHTVDPLPLSGEGVEWQAMHFDFLGKHPILQLWIWDQGSGTAAGEAMVQSLHWYVADAEKRKFTVLAEGVVRKRRLKVPAVEPKPTPPAAKGTVPKPPPKPKYLYDAEEKQNLHALKDGRLEWSLGAQKKILENVGGGHGI